MATLQELDDRVKDCEARILALQVVCLPLTRGWFGRLLWLVGR